VTERAPPVTWLILGGSSAVGRAFARQAAEAGCEILLAGRDRADLERSCADVRIRTGQRAEAIYFDADPLADHDGFVAACRERAARLDVFLLFGAMPSQAEIDADFALAQQTITANYVGAVSILSRLAPVLAAQGGGRIVVLSSVAGDRGRQKNYVYGSAKAALNTYLQGLRGRFHREGVRVTTVKAGFLDTAMSYGTPGMFLVAAPEDCARACLAAAGRKEVIYFPRFWWLIMTIIKAIPERIFKRLNI
jgi:NAD(P)-dependent dehydrogenase (short-subunit alcohol dehydrogenase family)